MSNIALALFSMVAIINLSLLGLVVVGEPKVPRHVKKFGGNR